MTAPKAYNPNDVVITLGGIIINGYADGTFVSVKQAEDNFSTYVGAGGEVTRVQNNNPVVEVELTLKQDADCNTLLSGLLVLDRKTGVGIVPFGMKALNSDTIVLSGHAWIKRLPDIEFGKEVSARVWQITLVDGERVVGGALTAGLIP